MQRPQLAGSLDLPFLGLGISATIERAMELLRSQKAAEAVSLSTLGFLNLGLTSSTHIPAELPAALGQAELSCVVHTEELNLVGGNVDEERLDRLAARCRILQPKWVQEDLGVWLWDKLPLVEHMVGPIFDENSLRRAVDNISRIREVTKLPFFAENPPMYFALGEIDLLSFMSELAKRCGCELLLDIGHFISYCLCTQRDPVTYLSEHTECLARVAEVHLAGYALTEVAGSAEPIWFDRHDLPLTQASLDLLDRVLAAAAGVKAITLEVEGSTDAVIRQNIAEVHDRVQVRAA